MVRSTTQIIYEIKQQRTVHNHSKIHHKTLYVIAEGEEQALFIASKAGSLWKNKNSKTSNMSFENNSCEPLANIQTDTYYALPTDKNNAYSILDNAAQNDLYERGKELLTEEKHSAQIKTSSSSSVSSSSVKLSSFLDKYKPTTVDKKTMVGDIDISSMKVMYKIAYDSLKNYIESGKKDPLLDSYQQAMISSIEVCSNYSKIENKEQIVNEYTDEIKEAFTSLIPKYNTSEVATSTIAVQEESSITSRPFSSSNIGAFFSSKDGPAMTNLKKLKKLKKITDNYSSHLQRSDAVHSTLKFLSKGNDNQENHSFRAQHKHIIISNIKKIVDDGLQVSSENSAREALNEIKIYLNSTTGKSTVKATLQVIRGESSIRPTDKEKTQGAQFVTKAEEFIEEGLKQENTVQKSHGM